MYLHIAPLVSNSLRDPLPHTNANPYDVVKEIAIHGGFLLSNALQGKNTLLPESPHPLNNDSEDDSSDEEFASFRPPAEILLEDVIDINNNLYRLATKIRNPATRLPSSRARLFERVDIETGVNVIEEMKLADLKHIEELFWEYRALMPSQTNTALDMSPEQRDQSCRTKYLESKDQILVAPLAQANTFQRQQFGHWERNHKKKAKETAKAVNQLSIQLSKNSADSKSRFGSKLISPLQLSSRSLAALSKPSSVSHLQNPSRFEKDDASSIISTHTVAPRALDIWDEHIDVPPPPHFLQNAAKEKRYFECLYCFTICPASQLQPDAWRQVHLLQHLLQG